MNLGIIGTGMIVKMVLPFYDKLGIPKTYILGTKDTIGETKTLTEEYNLNGYYLDYDELLESDDIDTVYIALPNNLHFSFALKALLKNKNVIIEKPITITLDELTTLEIEAKIRGLIVLEAMNIHHLPAYVNLKRQLGLIGDVRVISMNYSQYSSRYNKFKEGIILPAFDAKKGGGALMDINIYNIHFCVGLFGKPKKVIYYPNVQNSVDTSGVLIFDYIDFKAVLVGAKDCQSSALSYIQGEKGYICIEKPVNQFENFEIKFNDGESRLSDVIQNENRLYYEFEEFKRIIDFKEYDKADRLMNISKDVMEIIDKVKVIQEKESILEGVLYAS